MLPVVVAWSSTGIYVMYFRFCGWRQNVMFSPYGSSCLFLRGEITVLQPNLYTAQRWRRACGSKCGMYDCVGCDDSRFWLSGGAVSGLLDIASHKVTATSNAQWLEQIMTTRLQHTTTTTTTTRYTRWTTYTTFEGPLFSLYLSNASASFWYFWHNSMPSNRCVQRKQCLSLLKKSRKLIEAFWRCGQSNIVARFFGEPCIPTDTPT